MTRTDPSLLEQLSKQMGCEYLSDLRYLNEGQRKKLARMVERLTARDEALREWNDALQYLVQAPPERTARAAKERLVELLSQR